MSEPVMLAEIEMRDRIAAICDGCGCHPLAYYRQSCEVNVALPWLEPWTVKLHSDDDDLDRLLHLQRALLRRVSLGKTASQWVGNG